MIEAFLLLTVLAILIERALALLFEQKYIAPKIDGKGIKDIIAFGVCYLICSQWGIDTISKIQNVPATSLGVVITAMAIAGGSKASIKLFKDVLDVNRTK